jgi:hypothetical protein
VGQPITAIYSVDDADGIVDGSIAITWYAEIDDKSSRLTGGETIIVPPEAEGKRLYFIYSHKGENGVTEKLRSWPTLDVVEYPYGFHPLMLFSKTGTYTVGDTITAYSTDDVSIVAMSWNRNNIFSLISDSYTIIDGDTVIRADAEMDDGTLRQNTLVL